MYHFATFLALGLCAEPQDANKPAGIDNKPTPATADLIKLSSDLKNVMDRLEKIEQVVKSNNDNQNKDRLLAAESLQNQINDLIRKVGEMRAEMDSPRRPRVSTSEKKPDPTTATVLLVNARTDMPMATMVNGLVYSVEPNQNRSVTVPAGALRVQIIATDDAVRERTLLPGATHVVTLR
jgi:hypothetical protein